jgi:hypothetical protein
MRVQVLERPRMASTSTSSTCSSAAASGWHAFQRSSPASASSLCCAFATVMSGCVDCRRPLPLPAALAPSSSPARAAFAAPLRRDGCTRGGSPGCLRYWGGHGASPSPCSSCSAESASSPSSDSAASSMPAAASPRSANLVGAVTSVNAAGSQSATSSHDSGIDTRASAVGRTDHAEATVRSLAFWL